MINMSRNLKLPQRIASTSLVPFVHYTALASKITDDIYLGGQAALSNALREGCTAVLNCANEQPLPLRDTHDHSELIVMKLPLHDTLDQDLTQYIPNALRFIYKSIAAGKKVFVHCYAGVSRSAAIVVAYIMASQQLSFNDARQVVKTCRSQIELNIGFEYQLRSCETEIYKLTREWALSEAPAVITPPAFNTADLFRYVMAVSRAQ